MVEVAPRLDHDWSGDADPRIAISEAREAKSRELAPELFAIHPMYAREAEEEIVFLADAFLSHVPESGAHLPNYRSWLDEQDFTPAYDYLHRMLQFLQWQKRPARGPASAALGARSRPAHLGLSGRCCARSFPDLHIVHMHRDPRTTIASGASLNATLHAMHADTRRPAPGGRTMAASGWAGPMIGPWRYETAGPDEMRRGSPTSHSTTQWPIRSGRWPASTTLSACR